MDLDTLKENYKETLELTDHVCDIVNGTLKSLEDGTIQWTDALNFTPAISSAVSAYQGLPQVAEELKALTAQARSDLFEYIGNQINVPEALAQKGSPGNLEALIEKVLQQILANAELALAILNYVTVEQAS